MFSSFEEGAMKKRGSVLMPMGFVAAVFIFAGCKDKKSTPAAVVEPSVSGNPAPSSQDQAIEKMNEAVQKLASSGYALKKTVVPPGDDCRYGGTRIETAADADAAKTLEAAGVATSFVVCDGTIEHIGRETFKKYVHSIGIVINKSSATVLENGKVVTKYMTSGGTGWIVGEGLVVTNGHVAEPLEGLMKLSHSLTLYLPKTQHAAETILAKGLSSYAGFSPSLTDFDSFKASQLDLSPYISTAGDSSDLAFLNVPGVVGRAILPLEESTLDTLAGSPADVSDNGAKNAVNLGDGIFNINYSQVQGPRLSVGTVTTIQTCEAWLKTMNASCSSDLNVPAARRLLFWWGYGDHGGSGSPVFDRFGKVTAVFTFGSVPPDTFAAAGQFVGDVQYWLSRPRSWSLLN
jgi:hypothetical protein